MGLLIINKKELRGNLYTSRERRDERKRERERSDRDREIRVFTNCRCCEPPVVHSSAMLIPSLPLLIY